MSRNSLVALPQLLAALTLGAAVLAGDGEGAPLEAPKPARHVVVTLGDSITKGTRPGVKAEETFSSLLAARLKESGFEVEVVNLGVGGERTDGALARLDKEVLARKPMVVTVMYGTNDSYVDRGEKDSRLSAEQYRENLGKIVTALRRGGAEPLLMTEPRWAAGEKDGLGEDPNVRLERFVVVCREVARAQGVRLVDHYAHWKKAEESGTKLRDWTTDGCHPNPRGHREVADLALPALREALAPGELVFSVKTWKGEYGSRDVPGGVETTPVEGAIYVVRGDGTGLKKVIDLGKNTDFPSYSPDGRWLYFQSNASGRSHVYRCTPEGKDVKVLTEGDRLGKSWKEAFGYALSRDGRRLLYTVHDGTTGRVALADADGGNPRLLFPKLGYTYMGALSPAGDRAVVSGPARGYRLLVADLADGEPRDLTPDHPDSYAPQFTPDGKTIVFVRRDGDVYRVGIDGKDLRRLTEGNRYVEFRLSAKDAYGSTDGPQVSPDGKRVAYIGVRDGIPNVFVMNLDGSEPRAVTARKAPCGRVRWGPDGRHLAFVSFEGKSPQLFTVAAGGGEPRQITWLDGAVYFVSWRAQE